MTGKVEPTTADVSTAPPNIWCVRADAGKYIDLLVREGYFGYGGGDWPDMRPCQNRADIREMLTPVFPPETGPKRLAAYVGMMACFLWDIKAGDWVITPEQDGNILRYGQVAPGDCWYERDSPDGCHYTMRRKIAWSEQSLRRERLPRESRNAIKHAARTVFAVKRRDAFLAAIGRN